ncbi:hypothetical protein OAO87_03340 [bacterium]|nr:hypothetical protein [bacterium]
MIFSRFASRSSPRSPRYRSPLSRCRLDRRVVVASCRVSPCTLQALLTERVCEAPGSARSYLLYISTL